MQKDIFKCTKMFMGNTKIIFFLKEKACSSIITVNLHYMCGAQR
jgi:hypothetical protein